MPIHYKLLKVQYAFLITDDFKVQIRQVGQLKDKQFKSKKEAMEFIKNLKEIL